MQNLGKEKYSIYKFDLKKKFNPFVNKDKRITIILFFQGEKKLYFPALLDFYSLLQLQSLYNMKHFSIRYFNKILFI